MTFIGRLKQHSVVWSHWRQGNRVGGVLYGVAFLWEPGNTYRSGPLTVEQIGLMQGHPDVILEATGVDPPVEVEPAPVESSLALVDTMPTAVRPPPVVAKPAAPQIRPVPPYQAPPRRK